MLSSPRLTDRHSILPRRAGFYCRRGRTMCPPTRRERKSAHKNQNVRRASCVFLLRLTPSRPPSQRPPTSFLCPTSQPPHSACPVWRAPLQSGGAREAPLPCRLPYQWMRPSLTPEVCGMCMRLCRWQEAARLAEALRPIERVQPLIFGESGSCQRAPRRPTLPLRAANLQLRPADSARVSNALQSAVCHNKIRRAVVGGAPVLLLQPRTAQADGIR